MIEDVIFPEHTKSEWIEYIDKVKLSLDRHDSIVHDPYAYIETFQQLPKNFPGHQISTYCLYLGSFEGKDLYSYLNGLLTGLYSSAIVFGVEDWDYNSGNFVNILSEAHADHNELFFRQSICNLIPKHIELDIYRSSYSRKIDNSLTDCIRKLRKA
jgi:hypothetical protein